MTGGPVVSNAGPLIALAKLNLLHLLRLLYGRVRFAPAVFSETVSEGMRRGYPDAQGLLLFLRQEAWAADAMPRIPRDLAALKLDRGELESIALALALRGRLLMDEERGRAAARARSIEVRGTLGVLVAAYDRGILSAAQLRFHFAQIESATDIWISPALCRRVLENVLGQSRRAQGGRDA